MLGISSLISGLAGPVSGVINKFISKKEDQMKAQAELDRIQKDFEKKLIDQQSQMLNAQKDLITAEVTGHPFQRNWRPALMWIIILIIANNYLVAPIVNQLSTVFGWGTILPLLELPDKLFNLMSIGLGGYIVGRSAEKIVPQMAESKALITAGTTPEKLEKKKAAKQEIEEHVKEITKPKKDLGFRF